MLLQITKYTNVYNKGRLSQYPFSRDTGLCSAVSSNINIAPTTPINSSIIIVGERGASTTTTNTASIPDTSTGGGGASLSGLRSHQHRSCGAGFIHGSINAVRCITNLSDVIPSAALISVYEETSTGGVGVCEDSENGVNEPVVVPSAEPVSSKELSQKDVGVCRMSEIDTPTGDVGVCEDSEIDVNEPVVDPSAEPVSASKELSKDVGFCEMSEIDIPTGDVGVCEGSEIDVNEPVVVPSAEPVSASKELLQRVAGVCEMSEIDIPVVEGSDSIRDAPEKEDASSKLTILLMDTEPDVVVVLPEVELVDHVVQIRVGSEKCTNNAGGFEGKGRERETHHVSEKVYVGDQIGSCTGIKVMGESTAECPVMFACLKSKYLPLKLDPLLPVPG